jgi:hypothetical protein
MITEKNFLPFFQKNICIVLENKILRQGKLLLFSIKDLYIYFTLTNSNITKSFELPYPFDTYMENLSSNVLILDYKIKTFTKGIPTINSKVHSFKVQKTMKYYDSKVKIIESV